MYSVTCETSLAYRHRETFTTEEQLNLLDACSIVLDAPEADQAKEAAACLRKALDEKAKADQAQGKFIDLLQGGRQ